MPKSKRKNITKKFIHHYRWLIVDEDTQESKVSFRLNVFNFLLLASSFLILSFIAVFSLLKYSPVKEYFVNGSSVNQQNHTGKKDLLELNEKLLSLEDSLYSNQIYLKALSKVVNGDFKASKVDSLIAKESPVLLNDKSLQATKEDSIFRMQIAKEELESYNSKPKRDNQLLFPPVRGVVTSSYNVLENHLATDIAATKGEDVKTIANGKVILTEWSPDTGNIIIIQHKNELISIYKHCLQVYKKIGDEVEKGDVIASVGNTGELTTGPHLHFELFIQGNAVNAEDYIDF